MYKNSRLMAAALTTLLLSAAVAGCGHNDASQPGAEAPSTPPPGVMPTNTGAPGAAPANTASPGQPMPPGPKSP